MSIDLSRPAELGSSRNAFFPRNTVYCVGPAIFRSQSARDAACLLDLDESVEQWSCQSRTFGTGIETYIPDFVVERAGGTHVVDIVGGQAIPNWIKSAVEAEGFRYQIWSRADFPLVRLKNSKDLLRYARFETSLVDRLVLLTALAEAGSLRLSEAMTMALGARAIPVIASMVLHRQLSIDLDDELIGPDTIIRRWQY